MSAVVSIKWVSVDDGRWPEYIEVTLASGEVRRYRPEGWGVGR